MKEYFQIDFACGFILTAARILITEVSISPFSQCSDLSQTDRRTDGQMKLVQQNVALCIKVH